jgi:hypothetical protein
MAKLVGPTGVKGIDITSESGVKKYNADRSGFINVENPKHARQAKAEGFFEASAYSGMNVEGYPCTGCGFNSVFKAYTCWKCATENDFREVENGKCNKSDQEAADQAVSDPTRI